MKGTLARSFRPALAKSSSPTKRLGAAAQLSLGFLFNETLNMQVQAPEVTQEQAQEVTQAQEQEVKQEQEDEAEQQPDGSQFTPPKQCHPKCMPVVFGPMPGQNPNMQQGPALAPPHPKVPDGPPPAKVPATQRPRVLPLQAKGTGQTFFQAKPEPIDTETMQDMPEPPLAQGIPGNPLPPERPELASLVPEAGTQQQQEQYFPTSVGEIMAKANGKPWMAQPLRGQIPMMPAPFFQGRIPHTPVGPIAGQMAQPPLVQTQTFPHPIPCQNPAMPQGLHGMPGCIPHMQNQCGPGQNPPLLSPVPGPGVLHPGQNPPVLNPVPGPGVLHSPAPPSQMLPRPGGLPTFQEVQMQEASWLE